MDQIARLIALVVLGGGAVKIGGNHVHKKYRQFRLNRMINRSSKRVFNIRIESVTDDDDGATGPTGMKSDYGSGFMIEQDDKILTCHHIFGDIINSGKKYEITMTDKDNDPYNSEIIRCDKIKDLCLVQMNDYNKKPHIFRPKNWEI